MTGLKLRDDAYYAPTSDGITILTNSGEVVITGPSIFQWVDRLAPYLDGRHSLAELTASMPADRKAMTERVIHALLDKGVVIEATQPTDHGLTDAERQTYSREIDLLGYFGASGEQSFRTYRDLVMVIVGSGELLVKIVAAALTSGSRVVRVVLTEERPAETALLAQWQRRREQIDPSQQMTCWVAQPQQLSDALAGAGVVVYASDHPSVDTARSLDRACHDAGVVFICAMLAGDEAWVGPFGPFAPSRPDSPDSAVSTSWMSAWRRLTALDGADPSAQPAERHSTAALTVVAGQLVRELVRSGSATADPTAPNQMMYVDVRNLRTQRLGMLSHPFSRTAGGCDEPSLLAAIARLRAGDRLDVEEFSRRAVACVQPRLGVLSEVAERDFLQLPLAVCQVRVSDPVQLLGPGPRPVIFGADRAPPDARRVAVLRALATYASLMVDPRRLHLRAGAADPRTGDPERDLASLLSGEWKGFVWGHDLVDGSARELPATTVFPVLRKRGSGRRSGYLAPAGVAAGYDWAGAVRAGLLDQCRRLTLREVTQSHHPLTPVEWDDVALDERGDYYRSMATVIGAKLDIYDVTGAAGVPALAFCLGGRAIAYTCGFSFGAALGDGLAEVLLSWQASNDQEAGYSPAAVAPMPRRGGLSRVSTCPEWSTDEQTTIARLDRLGWRPVAVPLDHDPAVTEHVTPYLVAVVLAHA